MSKFIIAAVQMHSTADKAENLKNIAAAFEEAAQRGAKVVAFPETMEYSGTEGAANAEYIPSGDCCQLLCTLAKKHGMWALGTIHERTDENPKPYNTTFVVNPEGEVVSKYCKLHLSDMHFPGANLESNTMAAGNKLVVYDTGDYGVFGLSICYDIRFGEMYRLMTLKGANILFTPASFYMNTGMNHWEAILRTRAIENGCYLVAPAQCGQKHNYTAYGKSMIIDPWGNVLACASERPCVITAEVDLDYVPVARNQSSTLFNLRPDCYTLKEN